MRVELAVFDLNCVVVGLGDTCAALLRDSVAGAGVTTTYDDTRAVLGLPLRRGVSALFQTGTDLSAAARRTEFVVDEYLARLREHFSRQGSVRALDTASSTFAAVRALGGRVAVTTSLPSRVAAIVMQSLDWRDRGLVDTLVTCDDVDDPRPRPGMILAAMARTGCTDPTRVLAVGDTPAALVEGSLARCAANIGAVWGTHSYEELILRPHTHLVDELSAILDIAQEAPQRACALMAASSNGMR